MILQRILEHKKAELRRKQSRGYRSALQTQMANQPAPRGFIAALEAGQSAQAPALIAEIKKASPSQGLMRPEFKDQFDPVDIAKQYCQAGAHALSVLTDQEFFQGSLDYLASVNECVDRPTLNKEFMVEDIQFYEARAHGADCVLLIVAGLDRIQLEDFFVLATELGLDVLVETHNEQELDTVFERIPQARLIGINNRDLKTFLTDLAITTRLAQRIPSDKIIVSESGIHTHHDVMTISEAGAHAMLIGESLLRGSSIEEKIRELLPAPASREEPSETRWV